MTTVTAAGQFGPKTFAVSDKGVVVDAKWLTDSAGANYIIDPNTGKPYIVPGNYDPAVTAAYFQNKLNVAVAADNELGLGSTVTATIYPELANAFQQGHWGICSDHLPTRPMLSGISSQPPALTLVSLPLLEVCPLRKRYFLGVCIMFGLMGCGS